MMTTTMTAPDTPWPTNDQVAGDGFDQTATLSLPEIATKLASDLTDIQADGMIIKKAGFTVLTEGLEIPPGVLRVVVTGLSKPPATLSDQRCNYSDTVRRTIRSIVDLASYYNQVDRLNPHCSRFVLAIDIVAGDGSIIGGFYGAMLYQSW